MRSRSAFFVHALLLGSAWAGCTTPPPPVDEPGQVPMAPGVVVIGAPRDAAGTAGDDAAVPARDASSSSAPPGLPRSTDAATVPGDTAPTGSPLEGGGPLGTPNGGVDAGAVPPGDPKDAGTPSAVPPVADAGLPPAAFDAGAPPAVVDASAPPAAVDAGRVGCLPGLYKGRFQGEISALLGLVRIDVAGDITIEVDLVGAPGDRLQIRNGLLQGTDTAEPPNPLFARISGVLNCATKQLENGTITDGTYNRIDEVWGGTTPTTTTFTGTATATYSDNPPSAAGTWQVQNDLGTRTSVGTWNAALQ